MGNSCFKGQSNEKDEASRRSSPGTDIIRSWMNQIDLEGMIDERVKKMLVVERNSLQLDQQITSTTGKKGQIYLELSQDGAVERPQQNRHESMKPCKSPILRRDYLRRTEESIQEKRKLIKEPTEGKVQIARFLLDHQPRARKDLEPSQDEVPGSFQRTAPRSWLELYGFEQLVIERTLEKRRMAKDKLQNDLLVIANRRQNYGDQDQFPDGAFEALRGNNIWEKVLQYISAPSDINSAYFSCPSFAEILEEKRKLILLPEALTILLKKQYAKAQELLHLRGVSQSWKKVADMIIFDASFSGESWYLRSCGYCTPTLKLGEHNIDRALNLLPKHQSRKKPFFRKLEVKRCAFVEGQDENNARAFFEKVLSFLEFYGESIWRFSYDGPDIFEVPLYDYGYVRQMILKMPALKSIDLNRICHPHHGWEHMNDNPLPELEHLAVLGFHLRGAGGFGLSSLIYERCPNIKSFSDGRGFGFISRDTEMAVRAGSIEDCCLRYENFEILRNSTWPLKNLMIVKWHMPQFTCSKLWPILNKFSGTLETLQLSSFHGGVEKDDPNVCLKLPLLKVLLLFVKIKDGCVGLDDLLPLKSLEKLRILSYEDVSRLEDSHGLINIFGIQNEMEKSNIWKVFPHLIKLEIGHPDSSNGDGIRYIRNGSTLTVSGKRAATTGCRQILAM